MFPCSTIISLQFPSAEMLSFTWCKPFQWCFCVTQWVSVGWTFPTWQHVRPFWWLQPRWGPPDRAVPITPRRSEYQALTALGAPAENPSSNVQWGLTTSSHFIPSKSFTWPVFSGMTDEQNIGRCSTVVISLSLNFKYLIYNSECPQKLFKNV